MATTTIVKKEWLQLYDEFPTQEVGAGTIDPSIYSTPGYQKKKVKKIFINGMNRIVYGAFEHDVSPLVITLGYESAYNTILGINLHYIPIAHRQKLIKLIFQQNRLRIKKKLPFLLDYKSLVKQIPSIQGAVRRYKRPLIRVQETIPLIGWGEAIKDKSKWSLLYKQFM